MILMIQSEELGPVLSLLVEVRLMIWRGGVGEVVVRVVVVVGVDMRRVEEISLPSSLAACRVFSEREFVKHGLVAWPLHGWMGCSWENGDMHMWVLGKAGQRGHKRHCR